MHRDGLAKNRAGSLLTQPTVDRPVEGKRCLCAVDWSFFGLQTGAGRLEVNRP